MENFEIKIDLLKLQGAQVVGLSNQHGELIQCVVIPIAQAMLYQGEKSVSLEANLNYSDKAKYGNTHYIRQKVSRDIYNSLSEEQKKGIPFIGDGRPSRFQGGANTTARPASGKPVIPEGQAF